MRASQAKEEKMARFTICGMAYSDNLASNGFPVNIVTDDPLTFADARQSLCHFPIYQVVCTAQEGQTVARVELRKVVKIV